jgi:phage shock protein PspC (stress-responsive transcriptional regulator)
MFCTHCGTQVKENDNFCSQCGREQPRTASQGFMANPPVSQPVRRLHRSLIDKKIAGVCAGLGEYLEVDVTLVRLLVLVAMIMSGGVGLIAYIAAWIVIPLERTYEQAPGGYANGYSNRPPNGAANPAAPAA